MPSSSLYIYLYLLLFTCNYKMVVHMFICICYLVSKKTVKCRFAGIYSMLLTCKHLEFRKICINSVLKELSELLFISGWTLMI